MKQLASKRLTVLLILLIVISVYSCTNTKFEVINLEVEEPVTVGESFDIKAKVVNKWGKEGIYTAILKVDGEEVNSMDIRVPAESAGDIFFPVTFETTGTRKLEVGSASTIINVMKPAELLVMYLSAKPRYVYPGEEIKITATAKNIGEVKGSFTPTLSINNIKVDSRNLSLEPGATEDISFSLTRDIPGEYVINISGSFSGEKVTVRQHVNTYNNDQYSFSIMYPREWEIKEYTGKIVIQKEDQGILTITIMFVDKERSPEDLYRSNIGIRTPESFESKLAWKESVGNMEDGSAILRYITVFVYKNSSGEKVNRHVVFIKAGTTFYTLVQEYLMNQPKIAGFILPNLRSFKPLNTTTNK